MNPKFRYKTQNYKMFRRKHNRKALGPTADAYT